MFKKTRIVHEDKVQFGKCNKMTPKPGAWGGVTFMIIFVKKKKNTPPYNAHCMH
jgi:hypothetical protein